MKKIINSPDSVVVEACRGLVLAHEQLDFEERYKIVAKKQIDKNKVSLISGGGSGHEPAHAGFVGKGMLDAAVCGDMFASPSQVQVYNAILKTQSNKGTLLIIKNYSGDRMNFDSAASMAREDDDIEVQAVCVNDDIAVTDSLYTVGRRGVAGTIFVHKIAGAAAEAGLGLDVVKKIAQKTIDNVRSIGFALTSCVLPVKGTPTLLLGENEMEYGVGIHGEPGIAREQITTADQLAERMIKAIDLDLVIKGQEIAILINGFGGTPLQELYLLNNSVASQLSKLGVKVAKTFVGNYMTSIDMAGASISVLKLDDELKRNLLASCNTPALIV